MKPKSKITPLGIPLILAGVGTIASLFINKKLHAPFGILFAGLSLWHGLEHRKKIKADAKRLIGKKYKNFSQKKDFLFE